MTPPKDCIRPVGPRPCKVAIVGEAPGEQEEITGIPFMGAAGQELNQLLIEAGMERKDIFLTNFLLCRPPDNKFALFTCSKKEAGPGYDYAPIDGLRYLDPAFLPNLARLRGELETAAPNLVIAMGAKAAWALLGTSKIRAIRGTVAESSLIPGLKVLPTFHPAYLFRDWSARPVILTDLIKAAREKEFPDVRRPERRVYFDPTLSDLRDWCGLLQKASVLGIDIETRWRQITCIGFAPSPDKAYVIPFCDRRRANGSYWETLEDELFAWECVRLLIESDIPKLFQNGLYDLQYLAKMGFCPRNLADDTLILHHALFPEMKKDLGFLGSVYTNEASWKLMRTRSDDTETKRDE